MKNLVIAVFWALVSGVLFWKGLYYYENPPEWTEHPRVLLGLLICGGVVSLIEAVWLFVLWFKLVILVFSSSPPPIGEEIVLKYNGERFILWKGDIPGVRGPGVIDITFTENCQSQSVAVRGGLSCVQVDGEQFINGIKVSELIEKLRERKRQKNLGK